MKYLKILLIGGAIGIFVVLLATSSWVQARFSNYSVRSNAKTNFCLRYNLSDRGSQLIARGGFGHGRGGHISSYSSSFSNRGHGRYGVRDGSGARVQPKDGTGYGAPKNAGSGAGICDGTGPKGNAFRNGQSKDN